jgi:hypothetical protein
MTPEDLIEKFNEKFPVGARVFWRSCAHESYPHGAYEVRGVAFDMNGQAVAFLKGRAGAVSIEPQFVDYENIPGPIENEPFENYDLCEHMARTSEIRGRRRCDKCQKEVDEIFDSFWRSIIYKKGELDLEQMKGELFDFHFVMGEVSKVYDHITGGQLSKPNYHAAGVISEADKCRQEAIDEAVKEKTEEMREDVKILANCVECVCELFGYPKDDIIDFVTYIPEDFRKMTDEIKRLKIALADAVRRPMGVLPDSAQGLLTEKDLREAEGRRANKPYLETPCAECGVPVGNDYSEVGEDENKFVVCGECECGVQEGWEEFKIAHRKGEI